MKTLIPMFRTLALTLFLSSCSTTEETSKGLSLPSGITKTITLQYRIAHDAVAPSRFVVAGGGAPPGLSIQWNLPRPHNRNERKTQQMQIKQFYNVIEMLEVKQITGAEFECFGEVNGFELHAVSVPHLTETGRRQVENAQPGTGPDIWHHGKH